MDINNILQPKKPDVITPPKDKTISIHLCAADKFAAVKAWWSTCLLGIISIFVIYTMGEISIWRWGTRIVFIGALVAFMLFLNKANNEKKYLQAKYGFK